ncbi:MAG: hypothetical protein Q7S79_01680 [bacterium]|nr:hypothetical protein [bacterium]
MSEDESSPEVHLYSREEVIEAFKPVVAMGVTHPDQIAFIDPVSRKAQRILDSWAAQEERFSKGRGTVEADLEYSLSRSTVHVDAGFTDPKFLEEVADNWLATDLQRAKDAGLTGMVEKIQAKIIAIKGGNKFS